MRVAAPLLTGLVWLGTSLLGLLRGVWPTWHGGVALACALGVWGLLRGGRLGHGAALAGTLLATGGIAARRLTDGGDLAVALAAHCALVLIAFVLLLVLPSTRRGLELAVAPPPDPAALRLAGAGVVHLLALVAALLAIAPGLLHAHDLAVGVRAPYAQRTAPAAEHPELGVEWRMHPIDNPGDLLPNGLDPADVDGDGRDDYVTNYEALGRVRVAYHPGAALRPGEPWRAREVGRMRNAESSALGDLDGDGLVDALIVHGVEGTTEPPAARVYWGRPDRESWSDGGPIPASEGGWHFLYVKTVDLDGDGDRDVVVGGRASRMAFGEKEGLDDPSLSWAGIRWLENPGAGARDLARWRGHALDADTHSGHGFEIGDLDGDGDLDLVNASSDFDTPEDAENVAWYENPGPGPALRAPWPRHELLRSDEFYAKEQVVIADLDADGRADVLAQAPERIHWFRGLGPAPRGGAAYFEHRVIPKHPATQWRARPLEVADVDGDGRLDLVGALIHHDGALPAHLAAVFWMGLEGEVWRTHAIKWADGFLGLNQVNGEKWDQIIPTDVDGDGDVDLVANVEEYNRLDSILAVVWFENPRR